MKRNRIKWFVLGGLVLFIGGSAIADYNVQNHTTHYQNASTGLRVNESGDLRFEDMDRDRDYPVITTILTATTLNAGNSASNNTDAKDLSKFSRGVLLVTWAQAAAADSDSVNIAITFTQKSTPVSGIRYNLALAPPSGDSLTMRVNLSDTAAVVNSTVKVQVVSTGIMHYPKPLPTYYITRNNVLQLAWNSTSALQTFRIPAPIYRLGASTNGIAINIADLATNIIPGFYVEVTVSNLHPRKNLTGVQVDIVPRVN